MKFALLCCSVLAILATSLGNNGCQLTSSSLTLTLFEGCTVILGTHNKCSNINTDCSSATFFHTTASLTGDSSKVRHYPKRCKIVSYTNMSGTISPEAIRSTSGCSSYSGQTIQYKYMDATGCSCTHTPAVSPNHILYLA